jgi:hypothetical protein
MCIRATCPVHLILLCFDHSNYTWRRVQVTKFSPTSCHFIPFRSKYFPRRALPEFSLLLIFFWIKFWFVTVFPNIWTVPHFQSIC